MSLPTEMIGRCASFLDVSSVQNTLVSFTGTSPQIMESIRHEYLRGNLNYLLTIHEQTCWEKKYRDTLSWMKYNDWKAIFHFDYTDVMQHTTQENLSDAIAYYESIRRSPIFSHECCKPFYDVISCAERGIVEIAQYLLEQGHDVNQEVTIDNSHFEHHHRALNAALANPSSDMILFLLDQHNLELNYTFQTTFGNTLVHFAAGEEKVSLENFRFYISRLSKEMVNARDSIGKTALHYVCWFLTEDYQQKAELLLKKGADVNAFGNDYQDPLQVLLEAGRHRRRCVDDAENLLKSYGAIEVRVGP